MKKIENTKQLGQLIRQERKNQGLRQADLAAVCGVGIRFLRELEQGKESCHLAKTLLVLQMLGCSFFVEGVDK